MKSIGICACTGLSRFFSHRAYSENFYKNVFSIPILFSRFFALKRLLFFVTLFLFFHTRVDLLVLRTVKRRVSICERVCAVVQCCWCWWWCRIVVRFTTASGHRGAACQRGASGPAGLGQASPAVGETSLFQPAADATHGVRRSLRHAGGAVLSPAARVHRLPDRLWPVCRERTARHCRRQTMMSTGPPTQLSIFLSLSLSLCLSLCSIAKVVYLKIVHIYCIFPGPHVANTQQGDGVLWRQTSSMMGSAAEQCS